MRAERDAGGAGAAGRERAGDGAWGAGLGGAPPGNCSGLVLPGAKKGEGESRSVAAPLPRAPAPCAPPRGSPSLSVPPAGGRGLLPVPQPHLEREPEKGISVPGAPPRSPSKPATVGALERREKPAGGALCLKERKGSGRRECELLRGGRPSVTGKENKYPSVKRP